MFLSLCYQFIFYVPFRLGNLHSFQSCKSQKREYMCDLIFWNNAKWKAPNVMGYVNQYDNKFAHVSFWMIKLNASDEKKYVGFSLKVHCALIC